MDDELLATSLFFTSALEDAVHADELAHVPCTYTPYFDIFHCNGHFPCATHAHIHPILTFFTATATSLVLHMLAYT